MIVQQGFLIFGDRSSSRPVALGKGGSGMVQEHGKHQKHPRAGHRGSARWVFVAGMLAVVSLSSVGGVWVHRNSWQIRSHVDAVSRILARDRRLGVPQDRIQGAEASLDEVLQERVLVIPRLWLGSMAGAPGQVARVLQRAQRLPEEVFRADRRQALTWGRRVMQREGPFSSVKPAALRGVADGHPTIQRLVRDAHRWRLQALAWQAAVRRLAQVSGGLVGIAPKDVLTAEQKLSTRLAAQGPYGQGVVEAAQVLGQTRRYLRLPPSLEWVDHKSILERLRRAEVQLRAPNHAQLDAVLAGLSGGLIGNQPADVASLLASLESRLAGANADWAGYGQAQAAVQLGDTYLDSPPLTQIKHHAAVLASLKAAFAILRAPAGASPSGNPWRAAVVRYLQTRQSVVSIAVFNAKTGAVTTLNSQTSYVTASIVKATIMATLLWQSQNTGQPLTPVENNLMTTMIEDSDNTSATDLWDAAGQAAGIASFLHAAGISHTVPGANGYWGLTETTVLDQVRLVKLLSYPNPLLSATSRAYADNLMEHVVGFEDWGVSSGALGHATVMLKNGWLPIGAAGWEINSIGRLSGDGRNYVIALLSRNNPSESYGIQTLDTVSAIIWKAL